jgi:phosphoglycolate phosphatase-like HAD superfamily hydrolase
MRQLTVLLYLLELLILANPGHTQDTTGDPLPSWNEGNSKQTILDFVARVTKQGGPDFVPEEARIATFDNDGTLWTEQPLYTEFIFTIDRVKELAPQHPEWKTKQPYAAALQNDLKALSASGDRGMFELILTTHSELTIDQFTQTVTEWLSHAQQQRFHRAYTDCIYQPMVELLSFLRANGFKTYIVSGGEVEFMRPWTEKAYGIPPEQVIGTTLKTTYEMNDGRPVLERMPKIDSIDDGPGKPENIGKIIGRRPIAAFGNSDGDQQMLEWTSSGPSPSLAALVHHTDAQREYSYDRTSSVGRLDKALDEANQKHWLIIDMKHDWKTIFPPAPSKPRARQWLSQKER